jgi:hypothetical protein
MHERAPSVLAIPFAGERKHLVKHLVVQERLRLYREI